MSLMILAAICLLLAFVAPTLIERLAPASLPQKPLQLAVRGALLAVAIFLVASTSYVYIGPNEVGHIFKIYGTAALEKGRVIAANGEMGPQARILTYGFHVEPLLNVINHVETRPVVEVPDGKYGYLVANDGAPLRPDQAFSEALDSFKDPAGKPLSATEMLDAVTFLTRGGQKGAQITVLPPGRYILNQYLWRVENQDATEIEAGHVGVVKSNVYSSVNFGSLQRPRPEGCAPTHTQDLSGGALSSPLVPVGCVGIWSESLLPGKYYLNQKAYTITKVDTRLQTWEYKGGYKKRMIDLSVDQQGNITQTPRVLDVPQPKEAADSAVLVKVEGWDVPQELRVLAQVPPDRAPFVVAGVGSIKDVEDRIITPLVRSVVRNVFGGVIKAPVACAEEDKRDAQGNVVEKARCEKGEPIKDASGQLVYRDRPTKVLDLIENRPLLEYNVEQILKTEGRKAGPEIMEVRLGEPAIPPEMLVSRLRQQLADQLSKTYQQEKLAQDQRVATENARATASQQSVLVAATINVEAARQHKIAAQLEGEGEQAKLSAIAAGQKQQATVLGEDRVVELRKYELLLSQIATVVKEHPEVLTAALTNAGKFVPNTMVVGEGGMSGGIMALLTQFLNQQGAAAKPQGATKP